MVSPIDGELRLIAAIVNRAELDKNLRVYKRGGSGLTATCEATCESHKAKVCALSFLAIVRSNFPQRTDALTAAEFIMEYISG